MFPYILENNIYKIIGIFFYKSTDKNTNKIYTKNSEKILN